MADSGPELDVEEQQPPTTDEKAIKAELPTETAQSRKPKESAFKRFISGPYFAIIPAQPGRTVHVQTSRQGGQAGDKLVEVEDYLEKIKRIVTNPVDVDDVYGLTKEELVPLPFDAPRWHAYVVEILAGVFAVAQATVVMFIAIYVENQERAWKDGSRYTRSWYPLVKALVIIYPLVTLIVLVSFTVDFAIRKLMYFRLLSMRILVDWKNYEPWRMAFFYYFIGTWAIMNAWAIYGVAKYYKKDGNTGADPVSFGTFVVVNLQTIQLLLYYFKLLSTESRLVSLNQIFERAPVEAQKLLEFTYVIEEEDLIQECYRFAVHMQRVFLRRLLNLGTCCLAAKDWNKVPKDVKFDIERLKRKAPNFAEVERNVLDLKEQVRREEEEKAAREGAGRTSVKRDGGSGDAEIIHGGADSAVEPELPPEKLTLFGLRPLLWVYSHCYASLHSLHASVMPNFPSWPFRGDIPYFRALTVIQLLGIFGVAAIVVLGLVFSTSESSCTKATKTCKTCLSVHERYFSSLEPPCSSFETAITNIVASANGTWKVGGVVEPRYCNFVCYGNFSPPAPNAHCPVLSSSILG